MIAPAAPPATPPITAYLADLLHPFLAVVFAWLLEVEVIVPLLEAERVLVAVERAALTGATAAAAYIGSLLSFCTFHAWNCASPTVSSYFKVVSAVFGL